jgi:hypothetical protein
MRVRALMLLWMLLGCAPPAMADEAPANGCIVGGAMTSPVDIVRLPLLADLVEFRFESDVRECR